MRQLDNIFNRYKAYLDKTTARNTALSYIRDLERFIQEYDIKTKKDLARIKSDTLDEYVAALKSNGMAYSSIQRVVASLRKFFVYCTDAGEMKTDPTKKLDLPKATRKLPNTITAEEVVTLLEAPDDTSAKGLRDRAMLELMYATGAKVSEIINIKLSDVSIKNEIVIITSGKKHRVIPLGRACIDALTTYIKYARDQLRADNSTEILFLNFYGQPMTRQGFWKIIKHYIKASGIKGNVTAQTIRHSFALHLIKNGADVNSVSEMLGYSDVSSTKIYIDVMNNKIKEVYKTAHPRA